MNFDRKSTIMKGCLATAILSEEGTRPDVGHESSLADSTEGGYVLVTRTHLRYLGSCEILSYEHNSAGLSIMTTMGSNATS